MSPAQQDGEAQFTPQNVQHGMGQSKSSRRRRRKRKNKGSDSQQAAPSGADQAPGRRRPAAEQPLWRRETLEEEVPRPRPPTLTGESGQRRQRKQWWRLQQQRRGIPRPRHPSARQQQRRLQAQRRRRQ